MGGVWEVHGLGPSRSLVFINISNPEQNGAARILEIGNKFIIKGLGVVLDSDYWWEILLPWGDLAEVQERTLLKECRPVK